MQQRLLFSSAPIYIYIYIHISCIRVVIRAIQSGLSEGYQRVIRATQRVFRELSRGLLGLLGAAYTYIHENQVNTANLYNPNNPL